MQLEEYFNFLATNDIRLKETRIGIETILWDYLELGLHAEQIAARYPTLSLEQVYATLTYYWHNKTEVEQYLNLVQTQIEQQRQHQQLNPSPAIQRLLKVAKEQQIGSNL